MTRKPVIRWNLRQVMATRGMFQTTDLLEPLRERGVELSRQMVHRVVTKTPGRINTDLLAALCDILECTPNDLLELYIEEQQPRAINDRGPGIGEIRPIRTHIRRPGDIPR